jgi:hypothetical protein
MSVLPINEELSERIKWDDWDCKGKQVFYFWRYRLMNSSEF